MKRVGLVARPTFGARRSAREWAVRCLLAVTAAVLGYAGVTSTAGYAIRADDAARAHALAPDDGRITGIYAQSLSGADATPVNRARASRLAREALRQDPTVVAAVATLGLDTQIRGDIARARRLFAYAERLSRRDLRTQVWAVENAVGQGDIAGALQHYDIALRTSRSAPDLLFPVLASAIADGAVRRVLVATLARTPAWGPHFVSYAVGQGPDPSAAAALVAALRRAGVEVSAGIGVSLVDRLIGAGRPQEAWGAYASLRTGANRHRSRDPGFAGDPASATAFDWRPADVPGLSAAIQRDDRNGVLDFSAAPSIGGTVVQQVQMLPAGAYRLEGDASPINQPEGSRPYWLLSCRDGRELGRVTLPSGSRGVFAGRLAVPANCPVQVLALVVRSSETMTGIAGQVDRVQLIPAG